MAFSNTTPTPKATRRSSSSSSPTALSDAASWYCAAVLLVLILLASARESASSSFPSHRSPSLAIPVADEAFRGTSLLGRHCDEIYVVGEGETLHTIGDKCGDPFIVERNPHIHDPDDVFPGLVLKIDPSKRLFK